MRTPWTSVIVAAPAIVGAILWIAMLLSSAATGTHPIWNDQPRSLREAAAARDAGAVVRFIEEGQRLSPGEAAAATRDQDIVRLIVDETAAGSGAP